MSESQKYETVTARRQNGVLIISLNRPAQRNAVNGAMHQELESILKAVATDRDIRAIVLRGEGQSFCAGGDVSTMEGGAEQASPSPAIVVRSTLDARQVLDMFLAVPQPIVCALNGYAMGLGATIALLCDVVVMAEDAIIADTHVNMGLVAGDGGAVLWPLAMPLGAARWYLMTGDRLNGVEAARLGLALKAVPAGRLDDEAVMLAERMAALAPLAVQGTKATLNRIVRDRIDLNLEIGLLLEGATFVSEDHKAAVSAFVEKRPAKFEGR